MEQGLLWIWPESGADAWLEASAKPPVTTPEMADPAFAGAGADFAFMENPASLQVMLVRNYCPLEAAGTQSEHMPYLPCTPGGCSTISSASNAEANKALPSA